MKKQILLLMAVLSLSLVNCKKDNSSDDSSDDGGGDNSSVLKPVPVTTTQNDNSSPIFNLTEAILNQINGEQSKSVATTTTVSNFEYDGRHLIKVTSNTGTDVLVKEYHYADMSNGILDSIVYTKNGQLDAVDRYQVSNGHIQQISKYDASNTLNAQITFSGYNGDKPAQMSLYGMTNQGALNLSGNVTYTADDMTNMSLTGTIGTYNVSIDNNYTYDNKNNVMSNVETIILPVDSKHNILTITSQTSVSGTPVGSSTTTNTYTYNTDDFPISGTYSTSSASGTMEYVYEDK